MKDGKPKIYHRGSLVNDNGDVSALCFATPHAIDLKKAMWTNRDEGVTCPKCRAAIKRRAQQNVPREL